MKGRLWWIADDDVELANWSSLYFDDPGITIINTARMPQDGGRIQIIIELEREDAERLLGYCPEDLEWLEE